MENNEYSKETGMEPVTGNTQEQVEHTESNQGYNQESNQGYTQESNQNYTQGNNQSYTQENNQTSFQQGQGTYSSSSEPTGQQSSGQNMYQEQNREQNNYQQGQPQSRIYSYSNPNVNPFEEQEKKKKAKKEKAKKRNKFMKKAVAVVACAAVVGGVAGGSFYGVNRIATYVFHDDTQQTASDKTQEEKKVVTTTTSATTSTTVTDVTNVVNTVMPSVVSITSKATEVTQNFFGQAYQYETEGSGSGIIVGQSDTELLIATNNHVVEGSDELTVYFINDTTATAKIKGTDSDMDLAVIAVKLSDLDADTLGSISVATLGDSDALQVGEPAIAIGNALGYGQSVTTGVISALNRKVESSDESNSEDTSGFIQTDAAINPGNSGGALLNVQGQVIGINSMKISSGGYTEASIEGMGYAIPISAAKPIIDELMNKETRDKVDENNMGYLGIRGATIGDEMHNTYNMPYGIYVSEVVKGSAAEKAGLLSGDVIVKFDGIKIGSYEELQNQLQYYSAGETIELVVQRPSNGEYVEQTLTITLGSRSSIEQ